MYFYFKKCLCIVLLVLTLCVGIPCIVLVGKSTLDKQDVLTQVIAYTLRISVGNLFTLDLETNQKYLSFAKAVMYLNIGGIAILLIASVFIRRGLRKLQYELDDNIFTPSDFALMVTNIPKTLKANDVREQIEENFNKGDVTV